MTLEDLGWTPTDAANFAALGDVGVVPGRVVLEHNHVYRVMTAGGEVLAEAAGRMKHLAEGRHELPAVGDWVGVRVDPAGNRSLIRHVLPRRSRFARKAAGRETELQVVAANIDTVFVVFGLDKPVNPRAIDRYLVVARHSGTQPVLVLNKADLVEDVAATTAMAASSAGDSPVIAVSTRTGAGLADLDPYLLVGRTVALLGPSGAGKSTIVNHLVGSELLPTGEVREWDARGRHTSVHRQLVIRSRGGLVIDTPGMRELSLWESEGIDDAFADIAAIADTCRFRNCRHDTEPGCAVKTAAENGSLEPARLESFLKLQAEQAEAGRLRDEREILDAKKASRAGSKAMREIAQDRDRRHR